MAWSRVCHPPDLGGLGIVDLQCFGYALGMRWLWQRRSEDPRPWHELSDESDRVVDAMFAASIFVELGDGRKALFWTDRWLQGESISDLVPCLSNAVGRQVKKRRTVAEALQDNQWIRDISGALMVQVLLEYLYIWDLMREVQLDDSRNDRICWKWTSDKIFTTSSAYRSFFIGQHPIKGAKILQKMHAPAKCKFFVWLVLHDRCWTADRRKRCGLQDDDTCVLCNQMSETIDHLLLGCSHEKSFKALLRFSWEAVTPNIQISNFADWWTAARKSIPN